MHGNDALGRAVYEKLLSVVMPSEVEVIDGGIGGLTLLPFFRDCRRVLIVDLVKGPDQREGIGFCEDLASRLDEKVNNKGEHGGDLTTLLTLLPVYLAEAPQVDLLFAQSQEVVYFDTVMDEQLNELVATLSKKVQDYAEQFHNETVKKEAYI